MEDIEDNEKEKEPQSEPEPEKQPEEPALPELINEIKTGYEKRIADLTAKHTAEIHERDAVIQQLLTGNDSPAQKDTFLERLNKKRAYKKW